VLRGLANIRARQRPSLDARLDAAIQTYPGREVPNPLSSTLIEVRRTSTCTEGHLALTKLNYNTASSATECRSR